MLAVEDRITAGKKTRFPVFFPAVYWIEIRMKRDFPFEVTDSPGMEHDSSVTNLFLTDKLKKDEKSLCCY